MFNGICMHLCKPFIPKGAKRNFSWKLVPEVALLFCTKCIHQENQQRNDMHTCIHLNFFSSFICNQLQNFRCETPITPTWWPCSTVSWIRSRTPCSSALLLRPSCQCFLVTMPAMRVTWPWHAMAIWLFGYIQMR